MPMNYINLYNTQFVSNYNWLAGFYKKKKYVFTKRFVLRRDCVGERRTNYLSLNAETINMVMQTVTALYTQRIVTSLKTQCIWSCAEN
jgi:hypothetical protein